MTRFLVEPRRAVDTVFEASVKGKRGQTFVPKVPAANIVDLAKAIMGDKEIPIKYTGIRPGEKIHEIMVSEEECYRTIEQGDYYVILPVLPELRDGADFVQALGERILVEGRQYFDRRRFANCSHRRATK